MFAQRAHYQIVVEAIERFKKMASAAAASGEALDLFKVVDGCTTDVMQSIIIGERMPPEVAHELANMVWHLENQVGKLFRYHTLLPSFRRTMRILNDYLYRTIAQRKKVRLPAWLK